jgi:hypothetical protein
MIDISCLKTHLHPGPSKDKIDGIQQMGKLLAARINASFNLVGRRAFQFVSDEGEKFQALIHNEADDATDFLVIHAVGVQDHLFEAMRVEDEWVTNFLDPDLYDTMMKGVGEVLLEYANEAYKSFMVRNAGDEPEPLTEDDLNLDSFAAEMGRRKLTLSHHGNMRLAFR